MAMVKLIALLKRKPGISIPEFRRRWSDHTRLAARLPGLRGYRVNFALPDQDGQAPFDGTAELWWDSRQEMDACFATPLAQEACLDADGFTCQRIHIATEELVVVPGGSRR